MQARALQEFTQEGVDMRGNPLTGGRLRRALGGLRVLINSSEDIYRNRRQGVIDNLQAEYNSKFDMISEAEDAKQEALKKVKKGLGYQRRLAQTAQFYDETIEEATLEIRNQNAPLEVKIKMMETIRDKDYTFMLRIMQNLGREPLAIAKEAMILDFNTCYNWLGDETEDGIYNCLNAHIFGQTYFTQPERFMYDIYGMYYTIMGDYDTPRLTITETLDHLDELGEIAAEELELPEYRIIEDRTRFGVRYNLEKVAGEPNLFELISKFALFVADKPNVVTMTLKELDDEPGVFDFKSYSLAPGAVNAFTLFMNCFIEYGLVLSYRANDAYFYDNVDVYADGVVNMDLNFISAFEYLPVEGGCESSTRGKFEKTNIYSVKSYYSKNNNCLIEIFRNVYKSINGVKYDTSNLIRKNVLNGKTGLLDLDDAVTLSEHFGITIAVVEDGDIVYDYQDGDHPICDYRTAVEMRENFLIGDNEADIKIYYSNNHYSHVIGYNFTKFCRYTGKPIDKALSPKQVKEELIRQLRATEDTPMGDFGKKKFVPVKMRQKRYMFFDYETVYDDKGYLLPYSICAVYGYYEDNKFIELDRLTSYGISNADRDFFSFINKHNDYKYNNIMVGYNNSRFDNFILLETLYKHNVLRDRSIFLAGNSMLKMTFLSYTVIDLCRFLMLPLANATRDFGCSQLKGSFDHVETQNLYFNYGERMFEHMDVEKLLDYNVTDCTCLAELYGKVRAAFLQLVDQDIDDSMTISQVSYLSWQKCVKEDGIKIGKIQNRDDYDFIRKAVYAGRSQIFKKGLYNSESGFQSKDVKSLYPYVMMTCVFPTGEYKHTNAYVPGKMGIYNVKINSQPELNIIPLRTEGAPLNWTYQDGFDCVLTTVDIQTLLEHGSNIVIGSGIYFDNSSDKVFKSFIEKPKNEKGRQDMLKSTNPELYNPSLRATSKLLMNSLSGKVIQRLFDKQTIFTSNLNIFHDFMAKHTKISIGYQSNQNYIFVEGEKIDKKFNPNSAKPCFLGVFIYSYARRHMYKSILHNNDAKYGMDTDSCHINMDDFKIPIKQADTPLEILDSFTEGNEFGNFEDEIAFRASRYYGIAPKCYCIAGTDKKGNYKAKIKFKGIGRRDKLLPDDFDIGQFNSLPISEKSRIYESMPNALNEDLFKKLVSSDKNVNILSSQLRKIINKDPKGAYCNKVFALRQIYMVKQITTLAMV